MTNLALKLDNDIQESIKTLHKAQLNKKNMGKRLKIGNKYYRLNMNHYRVYKVIWSVLQGVMCLGGCIALYMLIIMFG